MCLRTSEDISELAAALAAAQPEIEGAEKNAANPHLRSKYANLTAVMAACRPALAKHGLCLVQGVSTADGGVTVTTRLLHKSGQWIESSITMPVNKNDAQGVGSAITYGRRYGVSAMVGVTPDEDDDGEAAKKAPPAARPQPQPQQRQQSTADGFISDAQRKRLYALAGSMHSHEAIKEWLAETYGITSSKEIPRAKYDEICARLERPAPLSDADKAAA